MIDYHRFSTVYVHGRIEPWENAEGVSPFSQSIGDSSQRFRIFQQDTFKTPKSWSGTASKAKGSSIYKTFGSVIFLYRFYLKRVELGWRLDTRATQAVAHSLAFVSPSGISSAAHLEPWPYGHG